MKKAIIIGSGFTGCMFAMMLKQSNWDVTVIDKSPLNGGGVRTFTYGGHPFTYGPRHFIGPEENISAFEFLNKIVPMRNIDKINYSYQAEEDFFANYPIHVEDLKKFNKHDQIKKELPNFQKKLNQIILKNIILEELEKLFMKNLINSTILKPGSKF